jgi:hypothetical protein
VCSNKWVKYVAVREDYTVNFVEKICSYYPMYCNVQHWLKYGISVLCHNFIAFVEATKQKVDVHCPKRLITTSSRFAWISGIQDTNYCKFYIIFWRTLKHGISLVLPFLLFSAFFDATLLEKICKYIYNKILRKYLLTPGFTCI